MVFGLTDGDLWYIPHRGAYEYGGYGVDLWTIGRSPLQVPIGFGERLLKIWLEMMYEEAEEAR